MNLKCKKCNSNACLFYKGTDNDIEYFMCRACGKVWREIKNKILDVDKEVSEAEMLELLPLEIFEVYTEAAIKYKMKDCLHKCVLCGSNSFEVELGFYQCSNEECGFEWEGL